MNAVILIPARYQSSRYPGKPLVELRGAGGAAKPLIQRSVEAARNEAEVIEKVPGRRAEPYLVPKGEDVQRDDAVGDDRRASRADVVAKRDHLGEAEAVRPRQ